MDYSKKAGNTKMYNFTELIEHIKYTPYLRAILSRQHANIVNYVIDHFINTNRYKRKVISAINYITNMYASDDYVDDNLNIGELIDSMDITRDLSYKQIIGSMYVDFEDIIWNLEETHNVVESTITNELVDTTKPTKVRAGSTVSSPVTEFSTSLEDVSLNPPKVPRFESTKPLYSVNIHGINYCIYESLPKIPTRQVEVSCTTNVSLMSNMDVMKLFPKNVLRTRYSDMYTQLPGMAYDDICGIIFPVEGFTKEQVLDNIVKYPHIYKLNRIIDGEPCSFYTHIEINGILYNVLEIWDTLPESKYIPKKVSFIKEYVVRRYLLERDVLHIEHKFDIFGGLDPFITLFMPPEMYSLYGYDDPIVLARQCVISRVAFKQARNPVFRMVKSHA